MSATTIDAARDTYVAGLRNQHAVEEQAISLLQRQVERLENYPEMEARMRQHIEESQQQARRLETLLGEFGSERSGLKDTMMSMVGNMAAITHAAASDEVMKNTFANYAFEHFEIASYKSLLELADLTGHASAVTALRQSLAEEEDMAQWIDAHLTGTTRTYVSRLSAGVKAGV
jgi:ferritin-like metal-binding protein YciE